MTEALAHDVGEGVGDPLGEILVGGFHHDAHHRLGARRAQQHATGVAEHALRLGDRLGDALVVSIAWWSTSRTLTSTCGYTVMDAAGSQRAPGACHLGDQVQAGEDAVAGRGEVGHDDVPGLLAAERVLVGRDSSST